uniref:Uncharacterized protein n=1 Tax=Siphoviridae sp. ctmpG14 TaxID=2825654 RepID=A0A8S5PCB2_9CAUD|nr:MAG TPA: hypothetical protein [Siphoviridae sp. ctmpG14]DAJ05242.1 MAG TPA: hypothetical protein [Caudoviricetes sp.]
MSNLWYSDAKIRQEPFGLLALLRQRLSINFKELDNLKA